MSERYPNIRIMRNGVLLIRDGLSIRFFMHRPHQEVVGDVERSLERYLQITGPLLDIYYDNAYDDFAPLDEAGWSRACVQMRELGAVHLLESGDARQFDFEYMGTLGAEDIRLSRWLDRVCAVEFWLPTALLEERGPGHIRDLALEFAALLPWSSGQVGLTFNGAVRHNVSLALRHPGIDIVDLSRVSHWLGTRVPGPAWLTFLGQPVIGKLGGVAGLRSSLHSPGTTVEEMPGGRALVTLGEWPEAGDLEQGRTLPAYRELARVLEPWLYHEPDEKNRRYFSSVEERIRWERRFLD